MTRSVILLSVLLGACTVGEVPVGGGDGGGSGSGSDITAVCAPRAAAAPAHQHAAAGANPAGARAGMGCLGAGCHGAVNPASTVFAFAGTIYTTAAGTAPAPGVTVHIYKSGTTTSIASAVTDDAGNFRISGTYNDLPYQTLVSGCGPTKPMDIIPMSTPIDNAKRDCNLGNCHAIPNTGGIGAAYLGN